MEQQNEWWRSYALTALRINRHLTGSSGMPVVIYSGPEEWRAQVDDEQPRSAGQLVEDCATLSQDIPFPPERAMFLRAQLRSMHCVAQRSAGETLPFNEYAGRCLGLEVRLQPEAVFEAAHAQLDAALPARPGRLPERLHSWQAAHRLPAERTAQLPELVERAVVETRSRTKSIVSLPAHSVVEIQFDPGPHRGQYHGDRRSTLYLNNSQPFNLADLLYVVAHEGFPGHIAESMLKQIHLVERRGMVEHLIRFMISPSFVISEGLGLHAQEIAFPGDSAQAWLTDSILAPAGIRPDGSDFAAIHDARNTLWGAWGNSALLVAEGRPETEVAEYLIRWALLTEDETSWALRFLGTPAMDTYVLSYYHGWRLLGSWLDHPERSTRVRRLLTEPVLPADIN